MTETNAPGGFRFRLRTLFIVTTVVAIPLAGYVLWCRAMDRFFEGVFAGNPGPVVNQEEWPRPLKQLLESATENNVEVADVQVYCAANGLSVAYVWRMKATDGLLELITQEYGLADYTPPEAGRFRAQDGLPDWWNPQDDAGSRYYAANLGEIGDQFVVLDDEVNQTLFVYDYDNW